MFGIFERDGGAGRFSVKGLALSIFVLLFWTMEASAQTRVVPSSRESIVQSFSPIVKKAAPAVVNIYVRKKVRRQVSPFFDHPGFRRFFKYGFRNRVESSLGSGVIVSDQGVVVTNYHVIKGAGGKSGGGIKVVLADKREFPATLILKDERTDLAILRIKGAGIKFPFIKFDDSENLEVGDLVLAIGNPFGVGQTVTSGIVSALARTRVGISDYQFFIQTDAAINPGNSGGALVGMNGKLVGINTAIFTRSGGSHGIGFAIPSNMVRVVVQSAIKGSRVKRPWLGAELRSVTSEDAARYALDRPAGALVRTVIPDSPAGRAGLEPGDVIVGVDGKAVADPRAFRYRFTTKNLGLKVPLNIIRRRKIQKIFVKTEDAPEKPLRQLTWLSKRTPFSGAQVGNLSHALSEELSVDDYSGVIVTQVRGRSSAQALGLRRLDIVLSINGEPIRSVEELTSFLQLDEPIKNFKFKRGKHVLRLKLGRYWRY